jgi:uncharacterized protein (DUF2141 family)
MPKRGIRLSELRGTQMQVPDTLGMLATGGTDFFGTANLYGQDAWDPAKINDLAVLTDGRIVAYPIPVPRKVSVDALRISVHTAADTGDKVRLGIYASDGAFNQPKTLIVDAGDTAIDTTGVKTTTFTALTLHPGLYWFALLAIVNGSTRPQWHGNGNPFTPYPHDRGLDSAGETNQVWMINSDTGLTALPDPFDNPATPIWNGSANDPGLIYIQARVA